MISMRKLEPRRWAYSLLPSVHLVQDALKNSVLYDGHGGDKCFVCRATTLSVWNGASEREDKARQHCADHMFLFEDGALIPSKQPHVWKFAQQIENNNIWPSHARIQMVIWFDALGQLLSYLVTFTKLHNSQSLGTYCTQLHNSNRVMYVQISSFPALKVKI